jgi:hypothetical protein
VLNVAVVSLKRHDFMHPRIVIVGCAKFKNYGVEVTSKIKMSTPSFLKMVHLVQKLKREIH